MTEPTMQNRPNNVFYQEHLSKEGISRTYDEWLDAFEKKLRALVENNAVCDDCPLRETCENNPYDCDALDALKKLFGKETPK